MNTNGLKLNGDEGLGFNGNVELTMPIEVGYEVSFPKWRYYKTFYHKISNDNI